MKTLSTTVLLSFFLISTTGFSMPDDRIVEVWECTMKEGKTMEAIHAANTKWVAFMNANVEGGVRSYVMAPKVGEREERGFMFVDSFPSLQAWAAADAAIESEEGKAIQAEINALVDCSKNALYTSKES